MLPDINILILALGIRRLYCVFRSGASSGTASADWVNLTDESLVTNGGRVRVTKEYGERENSTAKLIYYQRARD